MEASVADPAEAPTAVHEPTVPEPIAPEPVAPEPAEEAQITIGPDKPELAQRMFRYSAWLHVGPGAENCPEVGEGGTDPATGEKIQARNECTDERHFHAWCRLPNQFEHKDLQEKANAARARRVRQLRDAGTDLYDILDEEMEAIRYADNARLLIVDELVDRESLTDWFEAVREVQDTEEDQEGEEEPIKPFASIEDDERRLDELQNMDPDDRPNDEYEELLRHLGRYQEAITTNLEERMRPRREALLGRPPADNPEGELEGGLTLDRLLDQLRRSRIDSAGQEEFLHVYNSWEWHLGTLRFPPRGPRYFPSVDEMKSAPPEVLDALQATFRDLTTSRQRGLQGNS